MMNRRKKSGYTLVELIVSIAIFSLVMLIATAAYLSFINYNRHAQQLSNLMNSLSFVVDGVARDIRTGTWYSCSAFSGSSGTPSCTSSNATNGVTTFYFREATQQCKTIYKFTAGVNGASGTLTKQVTTDGASGCSAIDTGSTPVELIGPNVTPTIQLDAVKFYVRGAGPSDTFQNIVTFTIDGSAYIPETGRSEPFSIQSSATSRVPDL